MDFLSKNRLKNWSVVKKPYKNLFFCHSRDPYIQIYVLISDDLVISGLKKKWKYLKNHIDLPRKEFLGGISILLNSTYFKFNDKFYHQIIGSPMGGNSSPWFAEIE